MIEDKTQRRVLPQSELDLALMTTDSVWGKDEVHSNFLKKLRKYFEIKRGEGAAELDYESLWNTTMSYFTRDIRLGNLSANPMNSEVNEVRHYLRLAGDCLSEGYIKAFLACLRRVAEITEVSQSKGGFLRKLLQTFRQETYHQEIEPPKKSLFGTKKKGGP